MQTELLQRLGQRQSCGKLVEPAPSPTEIRAMLELATTVPDHGRLQPYRFIQVAGSSRDRLASSYQEALRRQNPDVDAAKLAKAGAKALAAPLQILIIMSPKEGKIPLWEQRATAACCGYALTLAADLLGLGAIWKSIGIEIDEPLQRFLGMKPGEELLGWVNLGQRDKDKLERQSGDSASLLTSL